MQGLDGITYLRPSGINTFLECSAKFYFEYIENVKSKNKLALAFGSAIHETLKMNFAQKIESKKDLSIDAAKDIFSDNFEMEFSTVDEHDFNEEDKPGVLKDQGVLLIEKYQKEVSPRIVPVAVEQKIKVKFKNYDYGLTGTVDLYDSNGIIVDHKTTKKEIKEVPDNYKRQISAYSILEEATGRKVNGARIDFLRRTNTEIRHKVVIPDQDYFLKTMQTVGDAIQKGVFVPNRNSFLCTKRFCKFYEVCEKKHGGIVKS